MKKLTFLVFLSVQFMSFAQSTVNVTIIYSPLNICPGEELPSQNIIQAIPSGGDWFGFTYQWTGPISSTAPAINANIRGVYTVVVSDASGNTASATLDLSNPAYDISYTVEDATDCVQCDGSITNVSVSGGIGEIQYGWNVPGSSNGDINQLCSKSYELYVTVDGRCAEVHEVMVGVENSMNNIEVLTIDAPCSSKWGELEVQGYSNQGYSVYQGATFLGFYHYGPLLLEPDDYLVFVAESSCLEGYPVHIGKDTTIDIYVDNSDISCSGANDGAAFVSQSETGLGALSSYEWSDLETGVPFSNEAMIEGLSKGIYEVKVVDTNNCVGESHFGIGEPNELELEAVVIDEEFGYDGSIELTITGGRPPYALEWGIDGLGLDGNQFQSNLTGGYYEAFVTDVAGCEKVKVYEVAPSIVTAITDRILTTISCYPNPANSTLHIEGLDQHGTYRLIDGQGQIVQASEFYSYLEVGIEDLNAGVYYVQVTNDEGDEWQTKIMIQ